MLDDPDICVHLAGARNRFEPAAFTPTDVQRGEPISPLRGELAPPLSLGFADSLRSLCSARVPAICWLP